MKKKTDRNKRVKNGNVGGESKTLPYKKPRREKTACKKTPSTKSLVDGQDGRKGERVAKKVGSGGSMLRVPQYQGGNRPE